MKLSLFIHELTDDEQIVFTAIPVGDSVLLVAKMDQSKFDDLAAAGAHREDLEDGADREDLAEVVV